MEECGVAVGGMALWVDKYRPNTLSTLTYHTQQAASLSSLVQKDDFPHLLIYGPQGAGKKTRIHCILRELYGSGADQLRLETKSFTAPSGKKLEVQTVSSNYHIELTPSDVGIYDRVVVQDVVKQMAQTAQIDAIAQKSFKVVVLMEMDALSRDAQHALRRTMEKYSSNCRLILSGESLSRVIDPLRSRCMAIRVAAPTDTEIRGILETVCAKEKVNVPDYVIKQVVDKSNGNLRRALLSLEAMHPHTNALKPGQSIPEPDWEVYLRETARIMVSKQSPDTLLNVRSRLYEVLSRCIPPAVVFNRLVLALLPVCPSHTREELMEAAAEYEHRLNRGQKAIFHLEAFVAAFMHIYSQAQEGRK